MSQHVEATVRFLHVLASFGWVALLIFYGRVLPAAFAKLSADTRNEVQPTLARFLVPFGPSASGATLLFGFILFALLGPRNVTLLIHMGMGLGIVMFVLAIMISHTTKRNLGNIDTGKGWDAGLHQKGITLARVNLVLALLTLFLMVFGAHATAYFPLPGN